MKPADIVAARKRAAAPATALEHKYGVRAPRRPVPKRRPWAAPVLDRLGNAKANGFRRSYSYTTAAESWAAAKRGET